MSTLRVGVLGCGNMSRGHAKRLARMPEVELAALCDVSSETVERFKAAAVPEIEYPVPSYTEPATMYADSRLDAVVISTPHALHFEQGMQALAAGCHVFMEKPMVVGSEHAYALAEQARNSGKILVVGYGTPCTPPFRYLRDKIRSKAFGALELVNGFLVQDWMKLTAGTWRQDPALSGGGQAYDSGAHILCSLVWSVESPVDRVFAMVDHHGAAVDINSVIAIRFENGVMGNVCIGGNCEKAGGHMAFVFERGYVEIDGWTGSWIKVHAKGEPETPDFGGVDGSPLRNFVDAVLGRCEPGTSPANGIHHSELMDAIYESAATGRSARPAARRRK